MNKAIHLKCGRDSAGFLLNLIVIDKSSRIFQSGNWDLTPEVAESLVGGWLYLHPTKAKTSEFGGKILRWWRVVERDKSHTDRIAFEFEAKSEAKEKKWRGSDHTMAWQSGLVEADYAHEK